MPIEFRCTECQKLLRVPDESAGAKAKCPQCSAIVSIPAADSTDTNPFGVGDQDEAGLPPVPESNPFSEGSQTFQSAPNPTGDGSVNPYSSPASNYGTIGSTPSFTGEIVPTPVDAGQVISYAWEVLKSNLGIMVGITMIVMVVNFGLTGIQTAIQQVFIQQGEEALGQMFSGLIGLVGNVAQIFLGIGQALIVLKLLRGQPAAVSDLFSGGPLFLRVLGASILAGMAMFAGVIACIIPGIILIVIFWPFYWLLVDEKAKAIESFGMASPIGKANVGTSILLWLASTGIMLAGLLAFCVGIFVAIPLVSLMWGTAYLMMSGQLSTRPR